jgi:hypothetical protein
MARCGEIYRIDGFLWEAEIYAFLFCYQKISCYIYVAFTYKLKLQIAKKGFPL